MSKGSNSIYLLMIYDGVVISEKNDNNKIQNSVKNIT